VFYLGSGPSYSIPMVLPYGTLILVVEDEPITALMIEDTLVDEGCKVVGPVHNVDAALAAIETNHLDGALLDINLNGVQSYAVADALALRGIPFILLTGYGGLAIPSKYRACAVCDKPFSAQKLVEAVTQHFDLG
jgi:CheY-like chemotaxis protein